MKAVTRAEAFKGPARFRVRLGLPERSYGDPPAMRLIARSIAGRDSSSLPA